MIKSYFCLIFLNIFISVKGQIVFPGIGGNQETPSEPASNPGVNRVISSGGNEPTLVLNGGGGTVSESDVRNVLGLSEESTRNSFRGSIGRCQIDFNSFGECLPYPQCPELQSIVNANGLTRPVIRMLRSRVCAVSGRRFRLCCSVGFNPQNPNVFNVPRQPQTPRPTVRPTPRPQPPRQPVNNRNIIPSENDCGFATTKRIVNGERFAHGTQPWLVGIGSINSNGRFRLQCGAGLITRRHVLSAAHCFVPSNAPEITHVILGEYSLSRDDEKIPPKIVRIRRHLNPGYNSVSHVNDLELIEFEEDVNFNEFIFPACLPFDFRNDNFVGKPMTILGWGDTFFRSGEGSDLPLKASVPVISRGECNQAYINNNNINIGREQICASSVDRDACQGDSGGPFIYDGRRSYMVGVVSFGVDCQSGRFPGVYTFIPHYLDWIQNNL